MAQLDVDPQILNRFGATAEQLGADVCAQSARGEFDTAAMIAVFGLIGADFVAAASAVTTKHNQQVETVGSDLVSIGTAVNAAGRTYTDVDTTTADALNLSLPQSDATRV